MEIAPDRYFGRSSSCLFATTPLGVTDPVPPSLPLDYANIFHVISVLLIWFIFVSFPFYIMCFCYVCKNVKYCDKCSTHNKCSRFAIPTFCTPFTLVATVTTICTTIDMMTTDAMWITREITTRTI